MLLTPSDATFQGILHLAAEKGSWDGADQGLINDFFGGEVGSGSEGIGRGWSRLPFTYNTTALGGYTYAPAFARYGNNVKVAHFIGADKPWRSRVKPSSSRTDQRGTTSLAARWWAVYQGYYPSQPPTPVDGSASEPGTDIEVRVTERGAEIIQRPRPQAFQVPVFQPAWDSVAGADASRALTIEELRQGFAGRSRQLTADAGDEGQYESLPLFGRLDLIAPRIVKPRTVTPPTSTASTTPTNIAEQSSHLRVDSQSSTGSWDATLTAPPRDTTPAAYQMRNPPDLTHFTNVWDKPAAQLTREEQERRRQVLNPNLRFQGDSQSQVFGYIPPEAREIHTFAHLSAKPDESLVRAVFPWEQGQPSSASQASTATRTFPDELTHTRVSSSDPSVGGGRVSQLAATRKWDDHAVYATPQSLRQHGSRSAQGERDFTSGDLVARYSNVWDEEQPASARVVPLASSATETRRQGAGPAQGKRSRRSTRSSGGSSSVQGGGGTSSRPTSTYVPNVYDDYVPAPRAPPRRSLDYTPGQGNGNGNSSQAGDAPRSNLTAAMLRHASANPSETPSPEDPIYGIEGSGVYDRTLSRLGVSVPISGTGEVEGSSSWSAQLSDLVRMGDQPGGAIGGGPRGSGLRGGGDVASTMYRARAYGEEHDGDDETSSDESRDSTSAGAESGAIGSGARSRTSSYRGGVVSSPPHVTLSGHSSSQPAPSTTHSRLTSSDAGGGGGMSSTGGGTSSYVTATDHLHVPAESSSSAYYYSSGTSGNEDHLPHQLREREGPGYMRKAQANSYVRSQMTPRSPRHGHHPLLGTSTTAAGASPATTIAVGSHSADSPSTSSGAGYSGGMRSVPDAYAGLSRGAGGVQGEGGSEGVISAPTLAPAPAPALTGRARIRPNQKKDHGPSAEYGYGDAWLG